MIWLRHLSLTDGQDLFGLFRLSPCPLIIPHAVLTWSVNEMQSVTAPQESDYEASASRFVDLSVKISSSRMQSKKLIRFNFLKLSIPLSSSSHPEIPTDCQL